MSDTSKCDEICEHGLDPDSCGECHADWVDDKIEELADVLMDDDLAEAAKVAMGGDFASGGYLIVGYAPHDLSIEVLERLGLIVPLTAGPNAYHVMNPKDVGEIVISMADMMPSVTVVDLEAMT